MIAVDIGNTNIHLAAVKDGKIAGNKIIPASGATREKLKKVISSYRDRRILVCSVVPRLTRVFKELSKRFDREVYIIGEDIKVPIKNFYDNKTIGMDRLVGAFAAKNIYPDTRLVIDFGTAITFDFLSPKGEYEGGYILPGIGSTLKVLSKCAMLPKRNIFKYRIKKPARAAGKIPRNTYDSIIQGIENGFSAMVNTLVKKYKREQKISCKEKVVVTGGDFHIIQPQAAFKYIFDPLLVIKGIVILENT